MQGEAAFSRKKNNLEIKFLISHKEKSLLEMFSMGGSLSVISRPEKI